ncbi:MAG: fumarylacetoacetate hydrolase family protein [Pseudohongiellaceae bacterium]|nr:fumarylacetoacetate hydrolase family protein [Pseudohongiellaceae bacterium]
MKYSIKTLTAGFALSTLLAASAQAAEYVRYEQNGAVHWGELQGDMIHQLADAPYLDDSHTGQMVKKSDVMLKAPVDPELVIMTALNFRSHITGEPADYPGLFMVPASSIIGPEEQMLIPSETKNFHYEAEAIVVIGKRAEDVSVEDAHEYIFGLTAGNDGSARDWQGADLQWARAKGSKTFNAVGPVLVTGVDYNNVDIQGRKNGEVVQGENTSDMLFNFDYMVSYISHYFVLEPGDIIWSGTMGRTRSIAPGDVYEVEVEGVGILRTQMAQGK